MNHQAIRLRASPDMDTRDCVALNAQIERLQACAEVLKSILDAHRTVEQLSDHQATVAQAALEMAGLLEPEVRA